MSLGYIQSVPLGFYSFRPVDLLIDLSFLYAFIMLVQKRLPKAVTLLLVAHLAVLAVRVLVESGALMDRAVLRTLFGMGAAYLAPVVFFVVRESQMTRKHATRLLAAACVLVLLSQIGLLRAQESNVAGAVDLASLLGIERPVQSLDYTETTISVWRALSVGITFAALVSRTGAWVKMLGLAGLLLQFAGGGGGRSTLLFVFLTPVVLLTFQGARPLSRRVTRLAWAGAVGVALGAVYFWAPLGTLTPVKDSVGHQERVTQVLDVFVGGEQTQYGRGGFSGRLLTWGLYWQGIVSNPPVLLFGTGLSRGAGFVDTPLGLAHNVFLDVWALTGIVGLLFTMVFLAYVVNDLRLLLRATPSGGAGQVISLAFAAAVIFMFQWLFFQAVTADRSFMIVFYLLAGLLRPTRIWLIQRRRAALRLRARATGVA